MKKDWEEQEALNHTHRFFPCPGDYWSHMFVGVMVVLAVTLTDVVICRTRKRVDKEHWTWDFDKVEQLSREEFAKLPLWKPDSDDGRCHCDVMPRRLLGFSRCWKELRDQDALLERIGNPHLAQRFLEVT